MVRVLLRRLNWVRVLLVVMQLGMLLLPPFQIHEVLLLWFQVGLCVMPATGFSPPMQPTFAKYFWAIGRESMCWPAHLWRFLKRGNL